MYQKIVVIHYRKFRFREIHLAILELLGMDRWTRGSSEHNICIFATFHFKHQKMVVIVHSTLILNSYFDSLSVISEHLQKIIYVLGWKAVWQIFMAQMLT
jgi:hypothetical protein